MEAKVIVTTDLQLKAYIADALSAYFKYNPLIQSVAQTDEIMTIQQAADFLNLTTQTVYGLVSGRKIPFSKPTGSKLYFSRLELIDWLKSHRTATIDEQAAQFEQSRSSRQQRKAKATA